MAEALPYLASPGSISKCLDKISEAATPDRVTGDFISTKLGIKGGSGRALLPFLKKIGLVNSDGTPSDLYIRFRNPSDARAAIAEAIKIGYAPLYETNEYAHELEDAELKGLIVQVTGHESDANVVSLAYKTFKNLKTHASFDSRFPNTTSTETQNSELQSVKPFQAPHSYRGKQTPSEKIGMNLSYTINLNLPATSDISVFNAIFKSLRDNLLDSEDIE